MKAKISYGMIIFAFLFSLSCHQQIDDRNALIIRQIQVYASHDEYCAWPAMIRAANGDLLISFCINEEHLGPDGKIVMVRSRDNGKTWSSPEVLYDTPLDDRHAGLTLLRDGTILTHCWTTFWTRNKYEKLPPNAYEPDMIERWCRHVEQPDYVQAEKLAGAWGLISRDHGHSWTRPQPGKDSIHGGIQLPDGSLLVASYRLEKDYIGVYMTKSADQPWQKIAEIHPPNPDSLRFGEPHILQLNSGRIIMMIRATTKPYNDLDPRCHLWATYSDDNGKTWVDPYQTPLWGFPPHLLQLSDGRILCTYGYRRPPFGQRACISNDGITWKKENEIILRDDAFNKDLGYPVSVELEPGKILSVYYQPDPNDGEQRMNPPDPKRHRPDILGTVWRVPKKVTE